LKLQYDKLPSTYAFNCNLRRYKMDASTLPDRLVPYMDLFADYLTELGRGCHSSACHLNLSRFGASLSPKPPNVSHNKCLR